MAVDDQLTRALQDLRSDVATLPLRPAADVRSRGDQRTRRHRAAVAGSSALAVAALVAGGALTGGTLQSRRAVVPPASGSSATASPTPSASASASPATSVPARPAVPLVVALGSVDPGSFLPASAWRGPDLSGGAALTTHSSWDRQGTVQLTACDVDTAPVGDVGIAQVFGTHRVVPVGSERLRRYATAAEAQAGIDQLVEGMRTCQQRYDTLPGSNALTPVTADPANATSGDGVQAFAVGVGSKDGGIAETDWVAVFTAGDDGTGTVGTIVLTGQGPAATNLAAVRRIAVAAKQRAATSSTAPSGGAQFAPPVLPQDRPGAVAGAQFGLISQPLPSGDDLVVYFNEATLLSGAKARAEARASGQPLRGGYYVQVSTQTQEITLRPGTPVWGARALTGSAGKAMTLKQLRSVLNGASGPVPVWVYFGGSADGPVVAVQEQDLPLP